MFLITQADTDIKIFLMASLDFRDYTINPL